ncbi:hypothetical protein [Kineococcus sp. SYSU DK002]|uniref:hypothetical protein n=1 Tax=Kineococcus sp. SYSU DK002 TaxID=3383123 RepID=UPI003D7E23AC
MELPAPGGHERPDDLRLIDRHLGGPPGPVLGAGCGPGHLSGFLRATGADGALVVGFLTGGRCEPFAHRALTAHRWPVDAFAGQLAAAGFEEVERGVRGRAGRRRPHGAPAARAGRWVAGSGG